jgi:hypothetical protein
VRDTCSRASGCEMAQSVNLPPTPGVSFPIR